MIEERLKTAFLNQGYYQIGSNVEGFYLFYRSIQGEATVISIIHALSGDEFSLEQYEHIQEQIKQSFLMKGITRIQLLNLIFTYHPEKSRRLCLDLDEHWIVDLNSKRLILYENQTSDFYGLRAELEKLLAEEMPQVPSRDNRPHRIKLFTPLNSILIGINILVYLLMHFTRFLGSSDDIIRWGGNFWYSVVEEQEYYRLVTALFMHSDLNHLFNNMLVLLFVGDNLERAAGKLKYLLIYFGSGVIADITSIIYNMMKNKHFYEFDAVYSIGASGAIFGIVGAMLYIIIRNKGRLEDISTRQIILFLIFGFYGGITNVGIDNAAHLGGFIGGLLLAVLIYRKPKQIEGYSR